MRVGMLGSRVQQSLPRPLFLPLLFKLAMAQEVRLLLCIAPPRAQVRLVSQTQQLARDRTTDTFFTIKALSIFR
jgi:hypothetical protein